VVFLLLPSQLVSAQEKDALTLATNVATRWERLEGFALQYRLRSETLGNEWFRQTLYFGPPVKGEPDNRRYHYVHEVANPGEPHISNEFLIDTSVTWDGKFGSWFERKYVSEIEEMRMSEGCEGADARQYSRIDGSGFLPMLLAGTVVGDSPLHRVYSTTELVDRWTYEVVARGTKLDRPATRISWVSSRSEGSSPYTREAWVLDDGSGIVVEGLFEDPSGEDKENRRALSVREVTEIPSVGLLPKAGTLEQLKRGTPVDYEFEFVDCKAIAEATMKNWSFDFPSGSILRDLKISDQRMIPYAPEEERAIREYVLSKMAPRERFFARWGWTSFNVLCICVVAFAVYVKVRPSFAS